MWGYRGEFACICLHVTIVIVQMAVAGVKIAKPGGVKLDKFEESVSQVYRLDANIIRVVFIRVVFKYVG